MSYFISPAFATFLVKFLAAVYFLLAFIYGINHLWGRSLYWIGCGILNIGLLLI